MLRKLKPAQIAEQMCLWNQQLFKNISSVEFLNQLWGDPDMQEYHSPNLTFFIQRFEKVNFILFYFILFYFILFYFILFYFILFSFSFLFLFPFSK